MAHHQEGQSQSHREFQDDLRSVSALTEIPQANRSDGTPVVSRFCENEVKQVGHVPNRDLWRRLIEF